MTRRVASIGRARRCVTQPSSLRAVADSVRRFSLHRVILPLSLALASLGAVSHVVAATESSGAGAPVEIVGISGVVDRGMAHYVEQAVARAETEHARAIVFEIDTPGGLVDAAFDIRDAVLGSRVPTIAYVSERAYSAGALIALSARTIVMAPGSSIGAAEPIPNDPKHVSALRAEFASTAARNHRDPILAAAMVDKTVAAPAFKKDGAILSLTADEAKRARIADDIAPTLDGALAYARVAGPEVRAEYTFGERIARFASSPEASSILLAIGVLGLLIELQTLHGIAGLVGVSALALFFGSHVYAGFSDGAVVALAVAGLVGIVLELHVFPGHGAFGVLGALALVAAVFLAFGIPFAFVAVRSIGLALVIAAVAFALLRRFLGDNAFFGRLAFRSEQGRDYVASSDRSDLLGRTGMASSFLRPAGVATVDGARVDVLTQGDFVTAGTPVRVVRVEGSRVFVEAISS